MKLNLLRLALKNIRSRRTRSWLTILGVLVGVTAIVALLSVGTGVQEAVLQQFKDIGYDIILIAPVGARQVDGRSAVIMGTGSVSSSAEPSAPAGTASNTFSPDQSTTFSPSQSTTFSPGQSTTGTEENSTSGSRFSQMGPFFQGASTGTPLDTDQLLEQVPELEEAGTLGTQIQPVDSGDVSGFLRVSTPSQAFLDSFSSVLGGFEIAQGTTFTNTTENQVVVGARTAETLKLSVGDGVTIGGVPFTVVGILASSGQALEETPDGSQDSFLTGQTLTQSLGSGGMTGMVLNGLTNTDDSLFVLNERATEVFPEGQSTAVTIARVKSGASISDTKDAINVAIGQQGASGTPISIQEVADEIQGTLGLIETVLASIAAVALIVGGVGLMNTMYTAVLERTREIGILKSVGARDGQVMKLFLIDSGLMGLIGGILGLVLGILLSLFGTRVLGPSLGVGTFAPVVGAWLIVAVLGFSFFLGALSGAWPAWRAARLNPVDALAAE